jgi:hypothetical protein
LVETSAVLELGDGRRHTRTGSGPTRPAGHDLSILTCLAAILPAIGTAIAGIRGQGDFGRVIRRSEHMSSRLAVLDQELAASDTSTSSANLAGLAEAVAECRLTGVVDWQFLFQEEMIQLPSDRVGRYDNFRGGRRSHGNRAAPYHRPTPTIRYGRPR